jgi:hypothetical protein
MLDHTVCKRCRERQANKAGCLCQVCWAAEQAERPPSPEPVGEETLLEAMTWVQSRPRSEDRTELQRDCRIWKQKRLAEFMAKRADLEKAALAAQAKASAPKGAFAGLASPAFEGSGECPTCGTWVNDQGSERVLELLREGMARDETEQARQDAEGAAQPGAKELGRTRQEALKAALWRERQTMLECVGRYDNRLDKEMFIDWNQRCRARDLELAVWPDPENVLGSLEKALQSTADREQEWRKGVTELEGSAA